jgi:hypothetical protein
VTENQSNRTVVCLRREIVAADDLAIDHAKALTVGTLKRRANPLVLDLTRPYRPSVRARA